MKIRPSYFNGVKLDWIIIVLIGLLMVLGLLRSGVSLKWQLMIFLGYGVIMAGWMVWRIRLVVRNVIHPESH